MVLGVAGYEMLRGKNNLGFSLSGDAKSVRKYSGCRKCPT
jgi:hypothetical protein